MTMQDISTRIHFISISVIPFGIALFIIAFLLGCRQQKPEEPAKKVFITTENLQTAYKKALTHQQMYTAFIPQAEKERMPVVANLYKAAARCEEIHARNHAALIRQEGAEPAAFTPDKVVVGTTIQTLKMAVNSEEIEGESMYPNLLRTADAENLPEAVKQFQQTMDSDLRHKELFQEALDKSGKISKVPYFVCPQCGYILTSDKTEECPVCKTAKAKFEKI